MDGNKDGKLNISEIITGVFLQMQQTLNGSIFYEDAV
jgi:hypothetical protein